MRTIASYGAAVAAAVERDARLYVSYRMAFVTQTFSAIFSVTLFYYLSRLVTVESFGSPDRYFEFVLVGLVILLTVTGTLATLPMGVRQELVAGTFERLILSPFGAVAGVLSMVAFPFLRSLVLGMVMVVFAILAFDLQLLWPSALLALPAAVLAALAFTPFSLFFTAAIFAFKQSPGMGLVMAAIALLAGLYFPIELLPDWIRWASYVQPFTPAVDLLRHLLVGTDLGQPAWLAVLKLVGFAVVLLPVGIFTMRAALRFGQRRGTVTEF
ncbi:MAG: ABC transporter permease [Actinomycetota bacterium]|nr:ABC transporter permease [Actinomycetota bacterium]